jgi:hypothetical protein
MDLSDRYRHSDRMRDAEDRDGKDTTIQAPNAVTGVQCSDCDAAWSLADASEAHESLRELRAFLVAHESCSYTISLAVAAPADETVATARGV